MISENTEQGVGDREAILLSKVSPDQPGVVLSTLLFSSPPTGFLWGLGQGTEMAMAEA